MEYPLRILIWHEIVKDVVGGVPVAVTFCPLCNTALVFDRRVDGTVLDFGTTGKLPNSDLVMYDRQTESWWQQFTGDAIVGSLLGKSLPLIPALLESFAGFKARNKTGKLLVPNDPNFRDYGRNPYPGYGSRGTPFLFHGDLPDGIDPMSRVVVARARGKSPVIVSLALIREKTVLIREGLEFAWTPGQTSALDSANISKGTDLGSVVVRTVAGGKPVPYDVPLAFAAHAFFPETPITY